MGKPQPTRRPRNRKGFTLIELLVVMGIIGILATVAVVKYKDSVQRARETVLKENLWHIRDAINQFKADRGVYPQELTELVDRGYFRDLPMDPITKAQDTWVPIYPEPSPEELEEEGDSETTDLGVEDVRSGAEGNALDGSLYSEW